MEWNVKFSDYSLDVWHPWFAWHPVTISEERENSDYKNTFIYGWAWLQYVDRRFLYETGSDGGRYPEYKKLGTFTRSTNVERKV